MSSKNSNFLFYSIIFIIILGILIDKYQPSLLDPFKYSSNEMLLKKSVEEKDYFTALKYSQSILNKNLESKDKNTLQIANDFDTMASIYILLKDIEKAKISYKKALNIKLEQSKQDTIEISQAYKNIANLYWEQKKFDESLDYYQKSLEYQLKDIKNIKEEEKGFFTGLQANRFEHIRKNNPDSINLYFNIGKLYKIKQENEKAQEFFLKAHDASLITYGKDNLQTKTIELEMEN